MIEADDQINSWLKRGWRVAVIGQHDATGRCSVKFVRPPGQPKLTPNERYELLDQLATRILEEAAKVRQSLYDGDVLREIRRLPEAEVVESWLALHMSGKHAGQSAPDVSRWLGKDKIWVEVAIPHELYDADWMIQNGLSESKLKRAEKYAQQPGPLPPGMATYNERSFKRGIRQVFVQDGNHRALASSLRGEPTARFYMPLNDWQRFRTAIEGEG